MRFLFALVLLASPITRFPGLFHLIAPAKASLSFLALGTWLSRRMGLFRKAQEADDAAPEPVASTENRPPFLRWINRLFIALTCWICLTMLLSAAPVTKGAGFLLAHVTVFAFFYPFLDLASSGGRQPWWMVRVFVASAVAVGSLAILQYVVMQFGVLTFLVDLIIPQLDRDHLLGPDAHPLPAWGYRSWGTFHHPNLLGLFLALALPIAAILPFTETSRRTRALAALAALVILAGIFCSGSRGAWLNVCVGAAVMVFLGARRIPKAWFLAPVAILPILGLIFKNEMWRYFRLDSILSNRDIIWKNTWTLVTEHPLFGTGPGTFSRTYLDRFGFPSEIERATALRELESFGQIHLLDHWHAHNLFLHYAAETGLIGAFLVTLIFVVYFKELLSSQRLIRESLGHQRQALLALGCSAAVAGSLVHSLLETTLSFSYPALGIPYVFVFALGLGAMQQIRERAG